MEKRKLLFIVIIVLCILLISVLGYFTFQWFMTSPVNPMSDEMKVKKNYEIVYVYFNNKNIIEEYYMIINNDKTIVDTRIIESGYVDSQIEERYTSIKNISIFNSNIEKTNESISYNSSINNGKPVDEIVTIYKNNSILTNFIEKRI